MSLDDSNAAIGRRRFLATSAAALGCAASVRSEEDREYGPEAQPIRYPDPDLVKIDEQFDGFDMTAGIVRLYHSKQMVWAEGPAWSGSGRYLLWSDIPNNLQMRWLLDDGHVSVFRHNAHHSNGNTFDFNGRQISFEHGTRSVVRYEHDGTRTVLASSYGGKSLNGPNDGVVHLEGDIFFSDAGYGQELLPQRTGSPQPYQKEAIYRIDAGNGKVVQLTDEIYKPNGVCFSPDYKRIYVADTGATHYPEAPRVIRVWDVVAGQDGLTLKNGRDFASMEIALPNGSQAGFADGMRTDSKGRIWASAGWVGAGYDGVHVFEPRGGQRVGMIRLPEVCSNVCFGGLRRDRLFMTASQSLYAVKVNTTGAHIT
jgi:gluconolactonase